MSKVDLERVYIKLGTGCNFQCKYCHAEQRDIKFNPDVLPVLKKMNLKRITFGGGEPLLYWKYIRQIAEYMGDKVQYRFLTNGTLFTQEIVDFCNSHYFRIFLSIDGINSTRDNTIPIRWDLIKQLKFCGAAVTVYRENLNLRETFESLKTVKERYLTLSPDIYSTFANFVHSTSQTGDLSDREMAKSYVDQITELAEESLVLYKKGNLTPFLQGLFSHYIRKKRYHGVRCCNDIYVPMLVDGTICICPYTFEKVGDIFHLDEIDWDRIKDKYARKSCHSCELYDICGDYCCMNVTDDECFIMRQLYKNVTDLMKKYDISYEELNEAIFHEQ